MAMLGLVDDFKPSRVSVRLLVELLAAGTVVASGARVGIIGAVPGIGDWPDMVLTVLWIVLVTNSFNLLDNSDGAAGSIAAMTAAAMAVLPFETGWTSIAIFELAISASCAGFLVHNWPPARIFMGDAGSLFLGLRNIRMSGAHFRRPERGAPVGLLDSADGESPAADVRRDSGHRYRHCVKVQGRTTSDARWHRPYLSPAAGPWPADGASDHAVVCRCRDFLHLCPFGLARCAPGSGRAPSRANHGGHSRSDRAASTSVTQLGNHGRLPVAPAAQLGRPDRRRLPI